MRPCDPCSRMWFATATALISELAEAARADQLSRALGRWERRIISLTFGLSPWFAE